MSQTSSQQQSEPARFKQLMARSILLPLLLMLVLAVVLLWQISRLIAAAQRVEHTDAIIKQANETQNLLLDMETGVRGFLITGDQTFLEPYRNATPKIDPAFDALAHMVADNQPQVERTGQLHDSFAKWRDYAMSVIAMRESGGDYTGAVRGKTGKNLMDGMRAQMAQFVEVEEQLRDERSRATVNATRLTIATAGISTLLLGGILAVASRRQLNSLSQTYSQALADERGQRESLRVTLSSIGDAVIATDARGFVTFMNPVSEELTGWRQADAAGQHLDKVFHVVNEQTRQVVESPVAKVLREGTVVGLANHTVLLAKDGAEIPIDDSGAPIRGEEGKIDGVVLVFRDVRERRLKDVEIRQLNETLEQRVAERTAQLEASNKELEAFSYSVSHDLRAPLRTIDGFSQALLEDYGDHLDAEGQNYLQRVRAASQRMGQLIDDMLQLSRVTRSEMSLEMIDLSTTARHITAELQQSQPDRRVSFKIEDNLIARADARLMRIVLDNLLRNAWKFTSKQPAAVIEFGTAATGNGQTEYFVRDNGAGFDSAYASKLFSAFQRLHKADEFEGTGVGLATVQRIIRRHGGHVRAEGGVDQGATFYFTL